MTTMSDEGQKICPVCTEEMDLTDRQLKPCKCGYEICVWCWHQIIGVAENDDTEGRCPACRTAYDKEKIVGTAANCARMMAEISSEKKQKSHKPKSKSFEGRKHLSSARVIQRNLVYVIGIPANLADECTLEQKEYFGQYGKVLKAVITWPTGGGQHSSNQSCVSVYITYMKEEEAVRCIQSVNGFTLDGHPLRACFGTTKYCQTWLRNMHCSNPDCFYLHEIGLQEDSFTKDEIVSAHTRIQQITGVTNSLQRLSGNVLPAPADGVCYSEIASSAKPTVKSTLNNPTSQVRISLPTISSGRCSILPASALWGSRVSNCGPPAVSRSCSQGPTKLKIDTFDSSIASSTTVSPSLRTDTEKILTVAEKIMVDSNNRLGLVESPDHYINRRVCRTIPATFSEVLVDSARVPISSNCNTTPAPVREDRNMIHLPKIRNFDQSDSELQDSASYQVPASSLQDSIAGFYQCYPEYEFQKIETSTSLPYVRSESDFDSRERSYSCSQLQTPLSTPAGRANDENSSYLPYSNGQCMGPSYCSGMTHPGHADARVMDKNVVESLLPFTAGGSILLNEHKENEFSSSDSQVGKIFGYSDFSNMLCNGERERCLGRLDGDPTKVDQNANLDTESNIISSILSLDLDSWDDPLSPHNVRSVTSEFDRQNGSAALPTSWKLQSNNESKFSFARQEDFMHKATPLEPSFMQYSGHVQQGNGEYRSFKGDKPQSGFSSGSFDDLGRLTSSRPVVSLNKLPDLRAQTSVPPGFSVPCRAMPPGFSSPESLRSAFNTSSGNQPLEGSMLRKQCQVSNNRSIGNITVAESIDPAILALGKGRLPLGISHLETDISSSFPQDLNSSDIDLRLQVLMQQKNAMSMHPKLRYFDSLDEKFATLNENHIPSQSLVQSEGNSLSYFSQMSLQQSRNSHLLGGQWDVRNEIHSGNEVNGMTERLRKDRLEFKKYFPGHELKFGMANTRNLYNKAFGM